MYQRQVSSRALSVPSIIDSSVPSAPGSSSTRLSTGGVAIWPDLAAPARWYRSRSSTPPFTQTVGSIASPLSNTDTSELDAVAARNGSHSSPGSLGSLLRSNATSLKRSPLRLPPPGAEKTLRPSSASRPEQASPSISTRSATASGGSST